MKWFIGLAIIFVLFAGKSLSIRVTAPGRHFHRRSLATNQGFIQAHKKFTQTLSHVAATIQEAREGLSETKQTEIHQERSDNHHPNVEVETSVQKPESEVVVKDAEREGTCLHPKDVNCKPNDDESASNMANDQGEIMERNLDIKPQVSNEEKTDTTIKVEIENVTKIENSTVVDSEITTEIIVGFSTVIEGGNNTEIEAGNSTEIEARNSTVIEAGNSSVIEAGNSTGTEAGNSTVMEAGNSTEIEAGNSTEIEAGNSTEIEAGNSTGTGSSTEIETGNSTEIDTRNSTEVEKRNGTESKVANITLVGTENHTETLVGEEKVPSETVHENIAPSEDRSDELVRNQIIVDEEEFQNEAIKPQLSDSTFFAKFFKLIKDNSQVILGL